VACLSVSEIESHGIPDNIEIPVLVLLHGVQFPGLPERRLDKGSERKTDVGDIAAFSIEDIE